MALLSRWPAALLHGKACVDVSWCVETSQRPRCESIGRCKAVPASCARAKASRVRIQPAVLVPQRRYSDSEQFVVDIIRNVVSNAGSESRTWSGCEGKPMLVRMLMVAEPRSHQVNRSRLEINVAHTIATFRATDEGRSGKLWCIAEKLPTTEAILPRIDQRKISIDLFRLTRRKFGSAIRTGFQLSDNKKGLKKEARRWKRIAVAGSCQR
jgi:hypothetical protein